VKNTLFLVLFLISAYAHAGNYAITASSNSAPVWCGAISRPVAAALAGAPAVNQAVSYGGQTWRRVSGTNAVSTITPDASGWTGNTGTWVRVASVRQPPYGVTIQNAGPGAVRLVPNYGPVTGGVSLPSGGVVTLSVGETKSEIYAVLDTDSTAAVVYVGVFQ
jgi:hypothetical protein